MPARSTLDKQTAEADFGDPNGASQQEDATVVQQSALDEAGSDSEEFPSPGGERLAAERSERCRQRALAHETPVAARKPGGARPRDRATDATSTLKQQAHVTLRDSVSVTAIARPGASPGASRKARGMAAR